MVDGTREALEGLRRDAAASIAELDGRIDELTAARAGDNSDDEHDPEGATLAFERSQASALRTAAVQRLGQADRALQRLAAGTWGRCEVCGEPIAAARLAARPLAERCIRHA